MDALVKALLKKFADRLPPLGAYPVAAERFAPGQMLAAAGEPFTRLCFVVEGFATVYNVMDNGRTALLTEYRGVQTIGEVELLMGEPVFSGSVRASTAGAMLTVPLAQAREQLLSDADMLRFLGREVARKLERSSRLNAQDRLYSLSARLAAYLLYALPPAGESGGRALHLTRVSELMWASYRHLLRTLSDFIRQGYILREGGGYRVENREALARLAGALRYD